MRFLAILAICLATSLGCGAAGCAGFKASRPDVIEVPIVIRNHLPTVRVAINGQPLDLFVDLAGFSAVSLTDEELATVGAPRASKEVVGFTDPFGNAATSGQYGLKSLELGGYVFREIAATKSAFGANAPPDRNGYIGMGLLARYSVVFNYAAGWVRLYPAGSDALSHECGARTFPLHVADGIATSDALVGSTPVRVLWDTGSTDNVVRSPLLTRIARAPIQMPDGPPVVRAPLSLQAYEFPDVEFRVLKFGAPDVDLVLGTPFFLRHKVCLDLSAGTGAVAMTP